jgi:hypothetical protein
MPSIIAHATPLQLTFPLLYPSISITPIPPTTAMLVVLPAALAGAITIGPIAGWSGGPTWTLPAGTPAGIYKAPFGATSVLTSATLSNPAADAATGAYVVCAAGTPVPPPYPAGMSYAQPGVEWPWLEGPIGAARGHVQAVFLNGTQTGGFGSVGFASGLVCVRKPLSGALVLSSPGGFTQTIAGGSSGVFPLSGATGPNCTWSLASAADVGDGNDLFVVGALA